MGTSLISNPPYNMKWKQPGLAGFMPQYQGYEIPPESNANYAFILCGLSKIDDKAVFLLPMSAIEPKNKNEISIRNMLIEQNVISAVILLPGKMFESTDIATCIILFDKNKQTRKIEMIDMRDCLDQEVREQNGQFGGKSHENRTYRKTVNVITQETMEKAIDAINEMKSEKGFCASVSQEQIKENNYSLKPSNYIDFLQEEHEHRPYKDIITDYNRIIRQKNQIHIRMNKTAAKRLGYDCMDVEHPDLTQTFSLIGEKIEKENYISFSANDGIEIKCSTKEGIPNLIIMFLNFWKQHIIYLNNEENRILAELRDAVLPDLMSGKIEI